MNNLESGLFLPIRMYESVNHQDRYKSQSLGVALIDLNYPYVDCKALAPFQIVYQQMDVATDIDIALICADTGTVTALDYDSNHWEEYIDLDAQLVHTSYLGTDDWGALTDNGLYYLRVTIVDANSYTRVYYSDLFMIANCITETILPDADSAEYRKYSLDPESIRKVSVSDLRITKTQDNGKQADK